MLNLNYKPEPVVETEGMPYDEWKNYRKKGIGGSDVAAIYNESPWTTARALYFTKLGIDFEEPDSINQYTLDFGHAIEPFVAQYFQTSFEKRWKDWLEKNLGKQIEKFEIYKDSMMYRHPLFPFMQANLDYRWKATIKDTGEEIEGIFECKSTNYHTGPEKWEDDSVPVYYRYQTWHYMAVMNLNYTIIACLWGNNESDYVARFIPRELDKEEKMINTEYDFWHNHVLARKAPELSENGTMELEAMKKFGIAKKLKDIPEIVVKSKEALQSIEDYIRLDEERANLEKLTQSVIARRDKEKVKIICAIGDAEDTVIKGKKKVYVVQNRRSCRTTIDTKALMNDYPDIYEGYSKKSYSTQFKIKPL